MPSGIYIRTTPIWNKGRKGRQRNHNIDGLRLGWIRNKDKDPNRLTYSGKHQWIKRNWGYPIQCETCGKTKTDKCKLTWANKDGKYNLNKNDWIQLCHSCHKKYDLKRLGFSSWNKGKKGFQPWMNISGLNGKGNIPWNKGKKIINNNIII